MKSVNDVCKFDYLRYRPFLVIEVSIHPKRGVNTSRKGWKSDNENVDLRQTPTVVYRISDKILRRADVIVDIQNDKMVKNRLRMSQKIDPNLFDKQILTYLKEKYKDVFSAH